MNNNVEYWNEAQTNISKVGWKSLKVVGFVGERGGGEVLGELAVDLKMLLMPVIQKLVVWRHCSAKLVDSTIRLL